VQLAGDVERERAAASLREHFVGGRLTLEELTERTEMVLQARSSADLRKPLAGLPQWNRRGVARTMSLVVFTGAWFVFSFVLLLVFGLTLLIHGATNTELAGFLVVWLVPTYLLSRLWRRPRRL